MLKKASLGLRLFVKRLGSLFGMMLLLDAFYNELLTEPMLESEYFMHEFFKNNEYKFSVCG